MSNIKNWHQVSLDILAGYEKAYGQVQVSSIVSIQRLARITEQRFSVSIDFERGPAEELVKQRILGLLARSRNKAADGREIRKIIVADIPVEVLSNCFVRFIQAKEICHIWLDDQEAYVRSPATLLDELALEQFAGDFEPKLNSAALVSERVTKYMASNVLFPEKFRELEKQRLGKKGVRTFDVADDYKIPEALVDVVLGDEYISLMKSIHG